MRVYSLTNASPMAELRAVTKRKTDMTRDLIFFGAFVKAYSRPVMDAKFSLNAIRRHLCTNG